MRRPDSLGSGRAEADVIIDLVLPRTRMSDFSQRQAQIKAGEAAARAVLPRMRQLIASQPGEHPASHPAAARRSLTEVR